MVQNRFTIARLACALVVAIAAIQEIQADEPEKLIGGSNSNISLHPYAASIRIYNQHSCGGAIISQRHIITAAHCLESIANYPGLKRAMTVVTGANSLLGGGNVNQVEEIYYHPSYISDMPPMQNSGFDVGVIKLAKPIVFNKLQQPAGLPTSALPDGVSVVVPSWGTTSFPNGLVSNELQELRTKTMSIAKCQLKHKVRLSFTEFCTYRGFAYGHCSGDSGSPLLYQGNVVGVVSSGIPCGVGFPDINTDIYKVRGFVDQILLK